MDFVLYLHLIGATVLLGTGAGIAFFMFMACRTRNPAIVAHVGRNVVLADMLFTTTAVIAQPVTGTALALDRGYSLTQGWLLVAIGLYLLVGAFWLPVVFIQMRIARIAERAAVEGLPLPPAFDRMFRIWIACGFPAFGAVLVILWLMRFRTDIAIGW